MTVQFHVTFEQQKLKV